MLLLLVGGALFVDHSCFRCSRGLYSLPSSLGQVLAAREPSQAGLQPSPSLFILSLSSSFLFSPSHWLPSCDTWVSVDCMSPVTKM